jgi:hypothetical protein
MGCLASVIGSIIALVVPVAAAQQGTDLVWVLFCWGTALAVFWIAVIISHGLLELRPSVRRCRRQLQESRERFPFDAALVLRPVPENAAPSSLRGGLFGRGFTQKPVRVEA